MQEEPAGARTRSLELGARADAPGRQRAGGRAPRRAQPPAGAGIRVEEVPRQASGLVLALGPAEPRPFLSRGRDKVTGKFGAPEESWRAERRRSARGKRPPLPPGQSRPGENLRARSGCGQKERPHLRAARQVEGVGEAGRRRRRWREGNGGKQPPGGEGGPRGHRSRWFPWRCSGKWSPAAPAPSSKLRHRPRARACGCRAWPGRLEGKGNL